MTQRLTADQLQTLTKEDVIVLILHEQAVIQSLTEQGIDPAKRETYANGVRKITYRDADGNEVGFGGAAV